MTGAAILEFAILWESLDRIRAEQRGYVGGDADSLRRICRKCIAG
jgi:hypothetical protein